MATAKKTTPAKEQKPTTALAAQGTREIANWEEEFERQAAESAKMEESTSTGAFFSLKAGVLAWDGQALENNQMACIVVDSILENVTYDVAFDSDNPTPPRCFAFSRTGEGMKPHNSVFEIKQEVNDTCAGCPRNEFKTAVKADGSPGKGKACRNTRRLALIPAGKLDGNGKFTPNKKADEYASATMGFMKLPVTSVANYSAFVKQIAGSLKRPPHGVFTKIKVSPDAKNQFKVTFEALDLVPKELIPVVMGRHEEAKLSIEQPYNLEQEEAAPAKGKPAAKKAAAAPAKKAVKRKF